MEELLKLLQSMGGGEGMSDGTMMNTSPEAGPMPNGMAQDEYQALGGDQGQQNRDFMEALQQQELSKGDKQGGGSINAGKPGTVDHTQRGFQSYNPNMGQAGYAQSLLMPVQPRVQKNVDSGAINSYIQSLLGV